MKQIIGIALAVLMTGCVTSHRQMLDPFMKLQNLTGPFVSEGFAERLARLVLEEKYPKDVFIPRPAGTVVDEGDTWWVTFDNAVKGPMSPARLTVHIRKANAEIVTIS